MVAHFNQLQEVVAKVRERKDHYKNESVSLSGSLSGNVGEFKRANHIIKELEEECNEIAKSVCLLFLFTNWRKSRYFMATLIVMLDSHETPCVVPRSRTTRTDGYLCLYCSNVSIEIHFYCRRNWKWLDSEAQRSIFKNLGAPNLKPDFFHLSTQFTMPCVCTKELHPAFKMEKWHIFHGILYHDG